MDQEFPENAYIDKEARENFPQGFIKYYGMILPLMGRQHNSISVLL